MTGLLLKLLGRLPIGWLQLSHSKARLATATAGVTFANVLVFVQLGILGALNGSSIAPYKLFDADIVVSAIESNILTDSATIARQRMFQSLGVVGVRDAAALYIGMADWTLKDANSAALQVYALDTAKPHFTQDDISSPFSELRLPNTALIDSRTRGIPPEIFSNVMPENPIAMELQGISIKAVGLLNIGSGFSADGSLMTSDQTFLRLFPSRQAGAPNHILLKIDNEVAPELVVQRLRNTLPTRNIKVNTFTNAIAADLKYQTTERPTGIIFGFGVLIGILVGIVIVYQVLATDVANHLKEYATFKAIGYDNAFFSSIIFEEAIILAVLGFIPGVLIALLIYTGLSSATGLPVAMDIYRALAVFIGTVVACGVSGAIATRRLAGADPADLF